ncbi:MAG: MerR family transcriptional regulator, partial [Actinomycetia bacterium]|nr:MerR family transcriptional regulator [Actinomycetes bacterium]
MNKLEIGGRNLVSIKDFAEIVGVQQSLLRHYDRIELFQPVLRDKNDYRFYSLQQIQTFKLIATLRSLRVSLEKIRELLAYRSPESMAKFLTKHEAVLHAELRALQENYLVIHSLRSA